MDREVTRDHARSGYRGRLCGTSPVPGGDRAAPRASVTTGPRARTDSCRAALALRVIVGRFCEHERNETSNCVSRSLALVWGTHQTRASGGGTDQQRPRAGRRDSGGFRCYGIGYCWSSIPRFTDPAPSQTRATSFWNRLGKGTGCGSGTAET